MESNIAVAALEILIIVGTIAGLIFFLDRKQSARMDRLEKRLDAQGREFRAALDAQGKELRAALDARGRDISALNAKVDRAQTTLDILVFGNPVVPPPVARSRAQSESEEAAVGD